jgi:hypothetical protein
MRTLYETEGDLIAFILVDLEPQYHQAALELAYTPHPHGFAKVYPADTPNLEQIYQQFAAAAEALILQTARAVPIPWEQALHTFLDLVADEPIDWWLAGSAALAVRGLPIIPRDFDLIVDDEGAHQFGHCLAAYLIEPVIPVQGWFCRWWGRAFLQARFEWVGGVGPAADKPAVSDFGPTAAQRLGTIQWQGRAIRVPPLDLQLQVSQRRGLTERAAQIQAVLGA